MERRKEPRYEAAQAATLTVLPQDGPSLPVVLLNVSGRGMGLRTPVPIAVNSMVRIKTGNYMYLGDICFCEQDDNERYTCGVHLEHVLGNMDGLAILAKRISTEIVWLEHPQFANSRQH